MTLVVSSYVMSGAVFLLFGLLALFARRHVGATAPLALACIVQAVWSLMQVGNVAAGQVNALFLFLTEFARDAFWLYLAASLLPPSAAWRAARVIRLASLSLPALAAVGLYAYDIYLSPSIEEFKPLVFILLLAFSVTGLILIEQVYRNSPSESRWGLKFLILGLGAIFAYDLFLFSHAQLFDGLSPPLWAARGFANVLALPLLIIGSRRYSPLSVEVFVSRQVVFFSATLMAVGIYLLGMALAGYLLRIVGGEWGVTLQVVFFLGALIVLAVILMSGNIRARLKVFLAKHFYANKYDYREQWLAITGDLGDEAGPRSVTERAIRALARIAHSPGGALWLKDEQDTAVTDAEDTFTLAGEWQAWDSAGMIVNDPLIRIAIDRHWVVHTGDVAVNPGKYDGAPIPDWLAAISSDCLLVPLVHRSRVVGFVALKDPKIGPSLDYEDIDIFKTAGRQIAEVLRQEQASRSLAESRQFEAYNRLTAFLMHDLKNLIAQQSLVVRNAEKYKHDPEFVDDAIETIAGSVERMERVIEQLKRGAPGGVARRVALKETVEEACRRQAELTPAPRTLLERVDGLAARLDRDQFVSVLAHVIRNAQEASDPVDGRVTVSLAGDEGFGVVAVADNGEGMSADFIRDRLFRPFDSTKGTKGMGIGAYQVRDFVESAGGQVRVESAPGMGTRFELRVPLAAGSGEELSEAEDE